MKKYRHQKTVLAKPMLHNEAEEYLGFKIPNLLHGSAGYVVTELDGSNPRWVPKVVFDDGATPIGSDVEKMDDQIRTLKSIKGELDLLQGSIKHNTSPAYAKAYTCRRHIELCVNMLLKIKEILYGKRNAQSF